MSVVLIETGGNQAYIFGTNRLRENVGASHLVYSVCTEWLQGLLDDRAGEGGNGVRPLVMSSGKAILEVDDAQVGRGIVRDLTLRAAKDAPGLEVTGVVVEGLPGESIAERVGSAHRELEAVRVRRRSTDSRFLRLPIVASCRTSGLPACRLDADGEPVSAASMAKSSVRDAGLGRLRHDLGEPVALSSRSFEDIVGAEGGRMAVVHADGNGIGSILVSLADAMEDKSDKAYSEALGEFSEQLDLATRMAVVEALGNGDVATAVGRARRGQILVLGGDDVTVVLPAKAGLPFAAAFLKAFEQSTAKQSRLAALAGSLQGRPYLTACAGVAFVQSHYPFSAAYGLAEALLDNAKTAARQRARAAEQPMGSALDYQVLYDVATADLGAIRGRLELGESRLYARPYFCGQEVEADDPRAWTRLVGDAEVLADRRRISSSQAHDLREALFLGREACDARVALLRGRAAEIPSAPADQSDGAVFWEDAQSGLHVTRILDALEAAEGMSVERPRDDAGEPAGPDAEVGT